MKLSWCTQDVAVQNWESTEKSLKVLSKLGYDGIEIAGRVLLNPEKVTVKDVRKLRELLSSYNIECPSAYVIHPGDLKHASPDEAIRKRSIEFMKGQVALAAELDPPPILAWGGGAQRSIPPEVPRDQGLAWIINLFKIAASAAEDHGVYITIEILNRYESNIVNSTDELLELIRLIGSDHVRVHCDIFHMNIEDSDLMDSIRKVRDLILHVHVSDSNKEAPGRRHINFKEIIDTLKEIGYNKYLSIEASLPINAQIRKQYLGYSPAPFSFELLESELRDAKKYLQQFL